MTVRKARTPSTALAFLYMSVLSRKGTFRRARALCHPSNAFAGSVCTGRGAAPIGAHSDLAIALTLSLALWATPGDTVTVYGSDGAVVITLRMT